MRFGLLKVRVRTSDQAWFKPSNIGCLSIQDNEAVPSGVLCEKHVEQARKKSPAPNTEWERHSTGQIDGQETPPAPLQATVDPFIIQRDPYSVLRFFR